MPRSLRARLLIFLLPPLVLILFCSIVAQYYLSLRPVGRAFDQALSDATVALSHEIDTTHDPIRFALSEASSRLLRTDSNDEIYYLVRGPSGEFISGDKDLILSGDVKSTEKLRVHDGSVGQKKVRASVLSVNCGVGQCQIEVAETLNKRNALLNDILLGTVIPQLIVGTLAFGLIWFGVGQALSPLSRLSRIIDKRSPRDLGPIDASATPEETKSLVDALNSLFEKLKESGSAQQRFIATAAHQLRTPLAALKVETELALFESHSEEIREKLKHINASTTRASRLATQLLALARAEPDAHRVDPFAMLDLSRLVEEHVDEWVQMAAPRNIDLGFELRPAVLYGKAILLRELMRNLVHNALEYSPPKGKATIRCGINLDHCYFEVEDNGSGIVPSDREKIFERFYRCPGTPGTGSGLGLAIAKEVTAAHDGTIYVRDPSEGSGTIIRVEFT